MRVYVIPPAKWLSDFLEERGMTLDPKEPKVLHYFGTSERILRAFLKKLRPDFLVTHTKDFFHVSPIPQAYFPVSKKEDIFGSPTIYTTSVSLTQTYFRRLSLQKRIIKVVSPVKKKSNKKFKEKIKGAFQKFKEIMVWD